MVYFLPNLATTLNFSIHECSFSDMYRVRAVTVVGGMAAAYLYNEEGRKVKNTLSASYRVGNLAKTVVVMTSGYAYDYFLNKDARFDLLSKLEQDLKEHEALQAELFAQLKHASSAKARARLQRMIEKKKEVIDGIFANIHDISAAIDIDKSELHHRNAVRLRNMCIQNKGLYIKLGQHLAMLDHIFPPEYQQVLTTLLDQNPVSPMEAVDRVFSEDFGFNLNTVFDSFESTPIASASLAQVHVAYKDGKKYAVKVQHEGLLEGSAFDRKVITAIVDFIPYIFPSFNYAFLTKEMNRNLPRELNFKEEMRNIEDCRTCLRDLIVKGDVAVPLPVPNLTSNRVLTMTFEEGLYIHKLQDIMANGQDVSWANNAQISELISKIFCQQIFRHGFVHCDPHEANLLIRRHPLHPNAAQIVLLDHGLYRRLEEDFRREYCRLWQSIVLSDEAGIEKHCQSMNAGPLFPLLAAMLTMKPWDDILADDMSRLKRNVNSTEKTMLRAYAKQYYREIVDLLGQVPSDLLLVFKTNDCLRHIDNTLGTPVNSTAVVANTASDIVMQEDVADALLTKKGWGLVQAISGALCTWLQVKSRVMFMHYVRWYIQSEAWLNSIMSMAYRSIFNSHYSPL